MIVACGAFTVAAAGGVVVVVGEDLVVLVTTVVVVVATASVVDVTRTGVAVVDVVVGTVDVDDVVDDIEHMINLVGPDHVGLGSDLYGLQRAPVGLEDIGKVPAITECMAGRGHSDEVILKVLGENFMRVFEHVWEG